MKVAAFGGMGNPVLDQFLGKLIFMMVPLMILAGGAVAMLPKRRRSRSRGGRAGGASRNSGWADDLVLAPWWVSTGLAIMVLTVLPRIIPVATPFAFIIAIFLFLIAGISMLRRWKISRMLETQASVETLREIPWKRFEDLIAEAYRRQGYKVEENFGAGADGGVDLRLGRDGKVTLVQCKQWPSGRPLSVQKVRELYGVMHAEKASGAKFVATTTFTSEAVNFAQDKPIELVDGSQLLVLLRDVQTSGKISIPASVHTQEVTPDCLRCGGAMVQRTARHGANAGSEFWGCTNYPKCRGTRESISKN